LLARLVAIFTPMSLYPETGIQIVPLLTLKGETQTEPLEVKSASLAAEGYAELSNPYELRTAHPQAYIGGCIRHMFPKGTTVVFFLQFVDGAWKPVGGPFSRWAEDVPSLNAPWVQLVRFYVEIATLEQAERRQRLVTEWDRLRAIPDDPVALLMAADVERQFE
jgi:hypothetical protein